MPVAAALVEVRLGEDVDEHLVQRVRIARLVDEVRSPGARPVQDLRVVRPVPVGPRERERPAERVDRDPVLARIPVRQLVAVVDAVIQADRVLALVLRVLAASESDSRCPAGSPASAADTRSASPARSARAGSTGMTLPGNGCPVSGSMMTARAGEEAIVRVEQLAEVAATHPLGRHDRRVGLDLEEVDPLLCAEEEELVLEYGSRNRPADREPVLLEVERCGASVLYRVACSDCATTCSPAATRRGKRWTRCPCTGCCRSWSRSGSARRSHARTPACSWR